MTFPLHNSLPRTHEGFLSQEDPDFNINDTPFTTIPGIHMVYSFPLDYMHLVCLGVMRTMLYIWMFGPVPLKLPNKIIASISSKLVSLKPHIPLDFCRKPRPLDEVKRWKATEFRQFLLYTGPLVLHDILLPDYEHIYKNFLSLHISMSILLNKSLSSNHQQYAKDLLINFVKTFQSLYGQKYITHNFHGLTHIADDVTVFGPLDNCSAFKFENYLYSLKKCVRKGSRPLQQVVKRLTESSNFSSTERKLNRSFPFFEQQHYNGPIFDGCNPNKQYNSAVCQNFKITTSAPNSCCLINDGSIVIIENFIYSTKAEAIVIICRHFKNIRDFFGLPFCASRQLNIAVVSDLSNMEIRPFSSIKEKMVLLKIQDNKHLALPLLHC
ncbi:uncharacterized protein LOC128982741 [Macrosteles quadrilineatus]|uniref:uncharacterized protein LOC128982741 n=1 Tax=Macrosteles quadrilineatus TaxID=74068 RepID=UPI0023E307D2|nr:uncharacterized protein LOC128982741 [Macrosteles quadrilineatus]